MVMSSTCMMVAIITLTVIRSLCPGAGAPGCGRGTMVMAQCPSALGVAARLGHRAPAEQARQPAAPAGVDLDRCTHAGAEAAQILAGNELHADRHALYDLDPVAGGVLRGQDRELRARSRADRKSVVE